MFYWLILLQIIFSMSAYSSFVITEIYGNSLGRGSDRGKEWIEIKNAEATTLIVESVLITTFDHHGNETSTSSSVKLARPLMVDDFLIIGQQKKLGFNNCVNREIKTILAPGFSINNSGKQKICVTINNINKCLTLSSKDKFEDGVSLYVNHGRNGIRSLNYTHCLLSDGVRATLGFSNDQCGKIKNIFTPCFARKNTIDDFSILDSKQIYEGKISDELKYILSSFRLYLSCDNSVICNPVTVPKIFNTTSYQKYLDGEPPNYLLINDLLSSETYMLAPNENGLLRSTVELKTHTAKLIKISATKYLLNLHLSSSSPVNIYLLNESEQTLWQRAFLSGGKKSINIFLQPNSNPHTVLVVNESSSSKIKVAK